MKQFNFRIVTTFTSIAIFVLLAVGSMDTGSKSSGSQDSGTTTEYSDDLYDPTEGVEQESSDPVPDPEPVIMYNSSNEESASDNDEEIIIITNSSEEEEL